MRWIAGWNLPGYLPEMDPVVFDTEDEAKNYLLEEIERFREMWDSPEDDICVYWYSPYTEEDLFTTEEYK